MKKRWAMMVTAIAIVFALMVPAFAGLFGPYYSVTGLTGGWTYTINPSGEFYCAAGRKVALRTYQWGFGPLDSTGYIVVGIKPVGNSGTYLHYFGNGASPIEMDGKTYTWYTQYTSMDLSNARWMDVSPIISHGKLSVYCWN